ncbi:MAG: hypothetical protein ACI4DR_09935 [Roseburia sp.]
MRRIGRKLGKEIVPIVVGSRIFHFGCVSVDVSPVGENACNLE